MSNKIKIRNQRGHLPIHLICIQKRLNIFNNFSRCRGHGFQGWGRDADGAVMVSFQVKNSDMARNLMQHHFRKDADPHTILNHGDNRLVIFQLEFNVGGHMVFFEYPPCIVIAAFLGQDELFFFDLFKTNLMLCSKGCFSGTIKTIRSFSMESLQMTSVRAEKAKINGTACNPVLDIFIASFQQFHFYGGWLSAK